MNSNVLDELFFIQGTGLLGWEVISTTCLFIFYKHAIGVFQGGHILNECSFYFIVKSLIVPD